MKSIVLPRGYGGYTQKAACTPSGVWIPRQFIKNWNDDDSKAPSYMECEIPDWLWEKNERALKAYEGRYTVKNTIEETHVPQRITKAEKALFDRHVEAYKNDDFEVIGDTLLEITQALSEGKTVKTMWEVCWGKASMTSQLIASIYGELTQAGIRDAQRTFKRIIRAHKIAL